MNIAIIPARGGSKRIPRKNIIDFFGKPLIYYSINEAKKSNLFHKIIVSTDDEEIANISRTLGADVPFLRPKDLSDDLSGIHEVIGHSCRELELMGEIIDYVCCIYPTAPLLTKEYLIEGYELIRNGKWRSIISATKYNYPIYRSFGKNRNGGLKMVFPEHYKSRSQDLPDVFHDAGQFIWSTPGVWMEPSKGFSSQSTIVEIPSYLVQDLDDYDDLERLKFLFKLQKKL